MHDHLGPGRAALFLRARVPWEAIDSIRRHVTALVENAASRADRAQEIGLAVHELLQNAVTHGNADDVELSVQIADAGRRIQIAVSNCCDATAAEELRVRLDAMSRWSDPLALYVATMRSAVGAPGGGLGLARIRYEARLALEAHYDGARVTVLANNEEELSDA